MEPRAHPHGGPENACCGNGGGRQALRYDAGVSVDSAMRRGADFLLIVLLLLLFCFVFVREIRRSSTKSEDLQAEGRRSCERVGEGKQGNRRCQAVREWEGPLQPERLCIFLWSSPLLGTCVEQAASRG